ncbi:endonuclease/exonuclease/phosphatase family protein [Aestuariibius sp. 2305UL40-4]|uniref:endonuclease/exonuclease/phosphatase family protein n=1 Tax=Aestuariibius violaceus TaxID=3234132 RepID=UPI00345E3CE1
METMASHAYEMADFSCITWNIHRCRGNDGRVDPARTVAVLAEEVWRPGTDALLLEEADEECPPHAGLLDIAEIERITGLTYIHQSPQHRWAEQSHGFLGTILFLRAEIKVDSVVLVDLPGHCHRGAVVTELSRGGQRFRLIGTHMSLTQVLRLVQLRIISQHIIRKDDMPTILAGDLNEWRPWGGLALSPKLLGHRFHGPAKATFPIQRPFLPLDRVLVTPPARIIATEVLDGPGIRLASDHRPLAAQVSFGN